MSGVITIEAKCYYSPTARRRYFTKRAAIRAEAIAIIKAKYPTEKSEHDDYGTTYHGFHWGELPKSQELLSRVIKMVKRQGES